MRKLIGYMHAPGGIPIAGTIILTATAATPGGMPAGSVERIPIGADGTYSADVRPGIYRVELRGADGRSSLIAPRLAIADGAPIDVLTLAGAKNVPPSEIDALLDAILEASSIPPGGTTGKVLGKASDEDYDFAWIDPITGSGGEVSWASVTNKPLTFDPAPHHHDISAVAGLQAALDDKASADHDHDYAPAAHGHAASAITQDPSHRFVTDAQIATWNQASGGTSEITWTAITEKPETATRWPAWSEVTSKPATFPPDEHGHAEATQSAAGFMSAQDKAKLDGVAAGANAYVHPATHTIAEVSGLQDALDAKQAAEPGKGLSANDYTDAEKQKLAGVEPGANAYTHPATHTIAEIAGLQVVLDAKQPSGSYAAADHGHAGMVTGSGITQIVALTQAAYDALDPKDGSTLYVVTG